MSATGSMPTARISTGQILYRVHGAADAARWYGAREASWRWDDPARTYGVLYLGRTLVGPFAETVLRRPWDHEVTWSRVKQKRSATFVTARPLRLARLHGPGLAWFGVTAAQAAADIDPAGPRMAYEVTQQLSAIVHRDTGLDGIQYRSRFDSDELCVALFDRADDALALEDEGQALDKDWVLKTLAARNFRLIDL